MNQAQPPDAPYDVVGLGVASYDFIGIAASEPSFGRKQPLAGWLEAGGGPVATALATLARLGARTCMAGAVGDDGYGERIIAGLRQAGVATEGMQMRPGGSHLAFVLAEPGRDRRTIWWQNDPNVLAGASVPPKLLGAARALLIDTHLPEAALVAAQAMRAAGGIVVLDAERMKESTLALLPHCDAQVVSARFGREASGEAEPSAAAQALNARYSGISVVTDGERGSWCAHGGEVFHTPAFAVEVVDTTGAGDVFHGGFLYGLLRGWPLPQVVRFASACAALKCRAPGGRAGLPTLAEVEAFLGRVKAEI